MERVNCGWSLLSDEVEQTVEIGKVFAPVALLLEQKRSENVSYTKTLATCGIQTFLVEVDVTAPVCASLFVDVIHDSNTSYVTIAAFWQYVSVGEYQAVPMPVLLKLVRLFGLLPKLMKTPSFVQCRPCPTS